MEISREWGEKLVIGKRCDGEEIDWVGGSWLVFKYIDEEEIVIEGVIWEVEKKSFWVERK